MASDPFSDERSSLLVGSSESNIFSDDSTADKSDAEPPPPPPPPSSRPRHFESFLSLSSSTNPFSVNRFNKLGSLDFERTVNDYSIQANRDRLLDSNEDSSDDDDDGRRRIRLPWKRKAKKHLLGYTGRAATRWALTVFAGIFTGFATVIMSIVVDFGVSFRTDRIEKYLRDPEMSSTDIFLRFSFTCVICAFLASLLCVAWVPSASGSGIPEVKAYLNGVRVKKFNSLSLFLVKIIGTIMSVTSSLAIGMEGPLIHIGAIMGASMSNLSGLLSRLLTIRPCGGRTLTSRFGCLRKLWLWNSEDLAHFSNDAERRDLVTVGAAVGFAASFGAPIGGLLFVLDDISSYFDKTMFLRVLVANALGTLCLAWYKGDLSEYAVINLGDFKGGTTVFVNRFEEVPLYILMGIAGGILGGVFDKSYEVLKLKVYDRFSSKKSQLIQIILLSLVTSAFLFYLPYSLKWSCKDVSIDDDIVQGAITTTIDEDDRRFFCEEGQVNELAAILFGSRTYAIRRILADPGQFQPRTLFTVAGLFYVLMLFTISSTIPTGVFTPTVLIGSSGGGAVGILLHEHYDSEISPSTFALLGIACMLTGIQRSTVSICVILVEGTGQIKVLVPVIVTVIVSRYVAHLVHRDGIYEIGMRLKGYPYLYHEDKKKWDAFEVRSIMSAPVATVYSREKASRLVRLLNESGHHGFPVVEKRTGKFVGLVRRKQIVALLECGVFDDNQEEDPAKSPIKVRKGNSGEGSTLSTPSSTPFRGVGKEPLMHLAYHIKDDRYDYLENTKRSSVDLEDDDFEHNAFLLSVRKAGDVVRDSMIELDIESSRHKRISLLGDDSLPPLASVRENLKRLLPREGANSIRVAPTEFATVSQDSSGNVIVKSLNPEYRHQYVNLGAVMNKGTYCVPENFPVSKAYFLFVKLGLRWIVVLGGLNGGQVAGVLTRSSFLKSHIYEHADILSHADISSQPSE